MSSTKSTFVYKLEYAKLETERSLAPQPETVRCPTVNPVERAVCQTYSFHLLLSVSQSNFIEKQNLKIMLWHDSFKDLLSSEEALDCLLKVDNAVSHAAPSLSSIDYDHSDNDDDDDDDKSISLFETETAENVTPSESQSLQHLGHFSFPITPRQRTLLLAGEPFQTLKKDRHIRPTRCSSFDDAMSTQKRAPRRGGRRRPARACSVDDLGKWAGETPASSCTNARMPVRRTPDESKRDGDCTVSDSNISNVTKPVRRLSNGSLC